MTCTYVLGVLSSINKSKNPRKTGMWVGGSSPNSAFFLGGGGDFVFFVLFFKHVSKKKVGWVGVYVICPIRVFLRFLDF